MIVDSHVHIWRALPGHPEPGVTIVSPASEVPLELFHEYVAEHAVDRAVLVQPIYPGEDNSYVADAAARQPDCLAAVCVVDPRAPAAPQRLAYWVTERGCRGLRLRPRLDGEAEIFGQPATYPLWEEAQALGIVVQILAGPQHLLAVANLAERFPDVAVVLDHLAHPDPSAGVQSAGFQALLDLARFPRVFVKLSGYYYFSSAPHPYVDCHDLVHTVYDCFGPEHLLWGSDFPHVVLRTGYRRSLLLPQRAFTFLTPPDRALILGGNAARLYWPQ
jgi:L-fuconolactonase